MGLSDWIRPPRHLLALFAVVTLVPAIVLLWLGWKVLEQDRRLEGQRAQDRLESASSRIVNNLVGDLRGTIDDLPRWMRDPPASIASGAVLVQFGSKGVASHVGAPLVFVPMVTAAPDPNPSVWQAGETLEDRDSDFAGAARVFRELSASHDRAIRAGALVRLAGDLRTLGRNDEALTTYRTLATIDDAEVDGEPADVVARAAECQVLAAMGRHEELAQAAAALAADLARGRWAIDRATYEFRLDQLRSSTTLPDLAETASLAGAVEAMWREQSSGRTPSASGFRSVSENGRAVLVVWRPDAAGLMVLAASPAMMTREWRGAWVNESVDLSLIDDGGHPVVGSPPSADQKAAVSLPADTGLPWTVRVSAVTSAAEASAAAWRRRLTATGLAALAFLIPVGGYVVARAVQKELAVARLQADFVSAVSHEFRTPLTAIAHLTDRLRRDPSISDGRRREYYDALARDTQRLGRFVETLLDFGRMEAGTAVVRLEASDFGAVVAGVIDEFRADSAAGGHRVDLSPNGSLPPVRLDRDSFGRALWNLLDNAAKYSPQEQPIEVEVARDGNRAVVRVRDHGIGVPAAEHRQIFHKFVRGADHGASGVRGTGVGLAMVDQIVRAHGGDVRLESEVGVGSVFSILLPVSSVREQDELRSPNFEVRS